MTLSIFKRVLKGGEFLGGGRGGVGTEGGGLWFRI